MWKNIYIVTLHHFQLELYQKFESRYLPSGNFCPEAASFLGHFFLFFLNLCPATQFMRSQLLSLTPIENYQESWNNYHVNLQCLVVEGKSLLVLFIGSLKKHGCESLCCISLWARCLGPWRACSQAIFNTTFNMESFHQFLKK